MFFRLLSPIRSVGRWVHTCSACTGTRVCPRTRLAVPPCAHPRLTHSISFSGGDCVPARRRARAGRAAAPTHRTSLLSHPWIGCCLPLFSPFKPSFVHFLAQLDPEVGLVMGACRTPGATVARVTVGTHCPPGWSWDALVRVAVVLSEACCDGGEGAGLPRWLWGRL